MSEGESPELPETAGDSEAAAADGHVPPTGDPSPGEATDSGSGDSAAPVLTDDEKNALLDGVASGEIEVHSADGPRYASVAPFVIPTRARLKSNSMPRLDALNEQLAKELADGYGRLLQAEPAIIVRRTRVQPFGDFCESWPKRSVSVVFSAKPLPGRGLIVLDSVLIGPLVEAFFGGDSPESAAHNEAAHAAGSLNVVQLLARETLAALAKVWEPLRSLSPETGALKVGLDLVDAIAPGGQVVHTEFEIQLGEKPDQRGSFCLVWAEESLAPVRKALEGHAQDRDPATDNRWQQSIRRRLPDVIVGLQSTVGRVRMSLGDVMRLKAGDVIGIDTPRIARLSAKHVPLIEGRFGVHGGRNAIEAVAWLDTQVGN